MTILVDVSLKCNFNCKYCYNAQKRDNFDENINLEIIKEGIKKAVEITKDNQVVLHGGEPLCWGKDIVEDLAKYVYDQLDMKLGIQTNGYLIDDEYVSLFKKYKVNLGISIDGYHPLNILRCDGNKTEKILNNIYRVVEEKIPTGLISVIHRYNGLPKYYNLMKKFISDMDKLGLKSRLNPCLHSDDNITLNIREAKAFYLEMARFVTEQGIRGWSPFIDIINSLLGKPDYVCTFRYCDPYSTMGGVIVTPRGILSMCDKFGTTYYERDPNPSIIRFEVLSKTDCKGCRYLFNCTGGCSANAINDDWRNKDRWCEVYYSLFNFFERRLTALGHNIVLGTPPPNTISECFPHGDHWEAINHE